MEVAVCRFIEKRVSLRDRINAFIPTDIEPSAELETLLMRAPLQLTRFQCAAFEAAPCGMRKCKGRPLDATVVLNRCTSMLHGLRAPSSATGAANLPPRDFSCHLTTEDVTELKKVRSRRNELDRMRMMMEMGLWHDVPPKNDITRTTNSRGERELPRVQSEAPSTQQLRRLP